MNHDIPGIVHSFTVSDLPLFSARVVEDGACWSGTRMTGHGLRFEHLCPLYDVIFQRHLMRVSITTR